jgi:phosphonate transport system substrate-binding protein
MSPDLRIRFGVSRVHGGAHLIDGARRFTEALSAQLGEGARLIVADDYEHLLTSVAESTVQLAWMPPLLQARANGAKLVAVCERKGITLYRSALLVRAESDYKTIADLRAARAAWSDPQSASGYLFPRLQLRAAGLDLRALKESFAGSASNAMSAVIDGRADLCACYVSNGASSNREVAQKDVGHVFAPAGWRLRVLAVTDSIPPDGFVLARAVEPALQSKITDALIAMVDNPRGAAAIRQLLDADRLVPVTRTITRIVERLRAQSV